MEHTANPDRNRTFPEHVPPRRVDVVVHTSPEDYPPAKMGEHASYDPYSADGQSQDKFLVLDIGPDVEDQVKRG